jgi:hypothetical protein
MCDPPYHESALVQNLQKNANSVFGFQKPLWLYAYILTVRPYKICQNAYIAIIAFLKSKLDPNSPPLSHICLYFAARVL